MIPLTNTSCLHVGPRDHHPNKLQGYHSPSNGKGDGQEMGDEMETAFSYGLYRDHAM